MLIGPLGVRGPRLLAKMSPPGVLQASGDKEDTLILRPRPLLMLLGMLPRIKGPPILRSITNRDVFPPAGEKPDTMLMPPRPLLMMIGRMRMRGPLRMVGRRTFPSGAPQATSGLIAGGCLAAG